MSRNTLVKVVASATPIYCIYVLQLSKNIITDIDNSQKILVGEQDESKNYAHGVKFVNQYPNGELARYQGLVLKIKPFFEKHAGDTYTIKFFHAPKLLKRDIVLKSFFGRHLARMKTFVAENGSLLP